MRIAPLGCVAIALVIASSACHREQHAPERAASPSLRAECFTRTRIGPGFVVALDDSGRVLLDDSDPGDAPGFGRAYVWSAGVTTRLQVPEELKSPGRVYDIRVSSMNQRGEVAGSASAHDSSGGHVATNIYIWRGGVPTRVPDALPAPRERILARAINDAGHVLAINGNTTTLLRDGKTIELGLSIVRGLTDTDVVAGGSDTPRALLWKEGLRIDLGPGFAASINEREDLAIQEGLTLAFYRDGTRTPLSLGGYTNFSAMNERGEVVGSSAIVPGKTDRFHAFLWSGGSLHDLGTLPGGRSSAALDINERGIVVGSAARASDQRGLPMLWDHGAMIALPYEEPFGYSNSAEASRINEHNVVAGHAVSDEPLAIAFLWVPDHCTEQGDAGAPPPTEEPNE